MFNKAILIGRLTAEPELKQTPSNIAVCSFSIACNRSFTNKSGERQTDFIDIVAWRSNAEFISKYFHKGSAIGIEGSIQTRTYEDKSGNKRKAVEVVVDSAFFVESKSSSANSGSAATFTQPPAQSFPSAASDASGSNADAAQKTYSSGDFAEIEQEDDLPF